MNPIRKAWFAVRELGVKRLSQYAWYQFQRQRGAYLQMPKLADFDFGDFKPTPIFDKLTAGEIRGHDELLRYAEQLFNGQVCLFGEIAAPLKFARLGILAHWSKTSLPSDEDVKMTWEPVRFQWVFTLGRAFILTGNTKYADTFWMLFEEFRAANPVNMGLNWVSAQEVGLRALAWIFAWQVFQDASSFDDGRENALLAGIAEHLQRIPPTMIYAESQENNHLLSEAAALYAGGVFLDGHPLAKSWKDMGRKWLNWCFEHQFDEAGEYIQHSTNYHRLALQLALLAHAASRKANEKFSDRAEGNLKRATFWLLDKTEADGDGLNFGHNDGANFLEWSPDHFADQRPTLQAAGRAFLRSEVFSSGDWDELSSWLGLKQTANRCVDRPQDEGYRVIASGELKARMRAKILRSRPAHMDQIHIQATVRGEEILLDTGTYSYSHLNPWKNALVSARNHNCVLIDGAEPMERAGQFLLLNRDQADWLGEQTDTRLFAFHTGFNRSGVTHYRELEIDRATLVCRDTFTGKKRVKKTIQFFWQFPDLPWEVEGDLLRINSEKYSVKLILRSDKSSEGISIVRGGELVYGEPVSDCETLGWRSPTYLVKHPILTVIEKGYSALPYIHETRFDIQLK